MGRILAGEVHHFMRDRLERELRKDLRNLKILKEGDAECCAYHHLRKFLRRDPKWRVFARKYVQRGFYPDLLIYKSNEMKFAVELKWRKHKISRHDRKKLRQLLNQSGGPRKAYSLSVIPEGGYENARKRDSEKYGLFELVVDLGYSGRNGVRKIKDWEEKRERFRH